MSCGGVCSGLSQAGGAEAGRVRQLGDRVQVLMGDKGVPRSIQKTEKKCGNKVFHVTGVFL